MEKSGWPTYEINDESVHQRDGHSRQTFALQSPPHLEPNQIGSFATCSQSPCRIHDLPDTAPRNIYGSPTKPFRQMIGHFSEEFTTLMITVCRDGRRPYPRKMRSSTRSVLVESPTRSQRHDSNATMGFEAHTVLLTL